jgi:uncharacterized protein
MYLSPYSSAPWILPAKASEVANPSRPRSCNSRISASTSYTLHNFPYYESQLYDTVESDKPFATNDLGNNHPYTHSEPRTNRHEPVFKKMPLFFSKYRGCFGRQENSHPPSESPRPVPNSTNDSTQVAKSLPGTSGDAMNDRIYSRDTRLLDLDALMDDDPITAHQRDWFARVNLAVLDHMNGPTYDASHDYEHCIRVVNNAHRLWKAEKHHDWAREIDPLVMYTAALVHDIGDEKYRVAEDDDEEVVLDTYEAKREHECDVIRDFLDALKVPPLVAGQAAYIASFVSFTRELNDPEPMNVAMNNFPALKFVQDADRLDALGPMGIARACVFGGIKEDRRNNTILTFLQLVDDRFVLYPGLMKTKTGKKEADRAWAYMLEFKKGMLEQADCEPIL